MMFMRKATHDAWVAYAQEIMEAANQKAQEYGEVAQRAMQQTVEAVEERRQAEAELVAVVAERDALIDTLREVQIILSKVPEFDGMGAIPIIEGTRQLVADHSELEARIEAVLTMSAQEYDPHQIDTDGGEMVLDRDEVHRLLRGGQRVPDTIEGIES